MGLPSIVIAALLAIALVALSFKVSAALRGSMLIAAGVVVFLGLMLSSIRYVGQGEVGLIAKNALGPKLPSGKIISTQGEMGPQALILPPGWHLWYWPVIYTVDTEPVTVIEKGTVGLLSAADGVPLPPGQIYAPEWPKEEVQKMLDADHFLGAGKGFRGPQATVLPPGTYRLNSKLFSVKQVSVTNVQKATVGVVKANVGDEAPAVEGGTRLVDRGQRGIWKQHLEPQEYYLNTDAYEVTVVKTNVTIVQFTAARGQADEREIVVRSQDGFTFPVDVRVEYVIEPRDAPLLVATVGGDGENLQSVLNSAVRAIFRNNAERVKALDYVKQRSQQEKQSLEALATEMRRYSVTVQAVRIGDVGGLDDSWKQLLKTQTDRELAVQEQITLQEQQRAAEQTKALTRTKQEAEEEKKLATAKYDVKIADEQKQRKLIEASAEAESIKVRGEAQARAFEVIAAQIGRTNAAMIELLKQVGEKGINITPRVMVVGEGAGQGQEAALMGTMLDLMTQRGDGELAPVNAPAR